MNLPEPVFIIALPKSYTSVFSAMLGQHPGLVAVPELNLFNGQTVLDWAVQPQNQFLCDGLLRTVAQLVFGAQSAQTVAQALDWLKARSAWKAPQLFDHLRGLVAPAEGDGGGSSGGHAPSLHSEGDIVCGGVPAAALSYAPLSRRARGPQQRALRGRARPRAPAGDGAARALRCQRRLAARAAAEPTSLGLAAQALQSSHGSRV